MILKALTLENFKGIREPVRIELAPLTLLFGPNNAGKSTVVQALMYAREVLDRNNCDARRTELGGDTVDLGGFANLVHGHDTKRSIRMRFELAIDLPSLAPSREPPDDDELADPDDESDDEGISAIFNVDALAASHDPSADLWVELEIGWLGARSRRSSGGPAVLRYCVGRGPAKYVEITVDDTDECARLSFLDSKLFPVVAAHYSQGEKSDFDWDLERLARGWLRFQLHHRGSSRLGLRSGATVAAPDEPVRTGANKMTRVDFDQLVSEIVRGEGLWGDDTINPETRKQNSNFRFRQELLDLAEAAGRLRSVWPPLWEAKREEVLRFSGPQETDREAIARRHSILPVSPELVELDLGDEIIVTNNSTGDTITIGPDGPASEDWKRLSSSLYMHPRTIPSRDEYDYHRDRYYNRNLLIPDKLWLIGTALPRWNEPLESLSDECDHTLRALSPFVVRPGELVLQTLKRDAIYLGPYRRLPSRDFQLRDAPSAPDWGSGLAAWYALAGAADPSLVQRVNDWLSGSSTGFRTDYSVAVHRNKIVPMESSLWQDLMSGDLGAIADSIRERLAKLPEDANKLELSDVRTGVSLAPQDLGVGMSQLIPVVVAALRHAAGIVAIEEPESNLHPAFQVVLADLFISQAKGNPDALFLIETHSEHLMLRCLRRIRETAKGVLPEGVQAVVPDDIAVHFVESTGSGPQIRRIEIDEDGDFIDEWPGGFFEESFHEKFAGR
jgi:predicted ATPase